MSAVELQSRCAEQGGEAAQAGLYLAIERGGAHGERALAHQWTQKAFQARKHRAVTQGERGCDRHRQTERQREHELMAIGIHGAPLREEQHPYNCKYVQHRERQ